MKLNLSELNQKLKKNDLCRLYLLFGEERYLVERYKKIISSCVIKNEDEFNVSRFSGNIIDYEEIIAIAETMPFFSDYRLIIVEESRLFKDSNKKFFEYIQSAPEYVVFLFVETEVDINSEFFEYLVKFGDVIEINTQKKEVLLQWIIKFCKKESLSVSLEVAEYILKKLGLDMFTISNGIERLCACCNEKNNITIADVDVICIDVIPPQIFNMVNAISKKNTKAALEFYYDLLENKVPVLKILSLLIEQFRLLYKVSVSLDRDESFMAISTQLNLPSYVISKLIILAKNFSLKELDGILQDCTEIENKIEAGVLTDKIGVELLIIKYIY